MANWLPSQVSPDANYITLLDTLALRDEDAAKMAETPTSPPAGYMRFSRSANVLQEWDGAVWQTKVLAVQGGGTGASSSAGAISGLGLGTMALQNNNAVNITGGTITGLSNLSTSSLSVTGDINITGGAPIISGATPQIVLSETDAPVNQKVWSINANSQVLSISTLLDNFGGTGIFPFITDRIGNTTIAGVLKVITGNYTTPDGLAYAISITNDALYFSLNEFHFRGKTGLPAIDFYHQTVAPASHPGDRLWINTGYVDSTARIIIGNDTTGRLHIAKKTGGVITDLFEFNISGQHRADWIKSLNSFTLTFEAYTAGSFTFRFFDTSSIAAVLISPSTFRINRIQSWDSFTLALEAFVEGGINFNLTGAQHAKLVSPSTLYVDTIKNLNSTSPLTIEATGSSPLISFKIAGTFAMSLFTLGVSFGKSIGLGGQTIFSPVAGLNNDVNIGTSSVLILNPPGADAIITGVTGGYSGRLLIIISHGSTAVIRHADAGSADANQFIIRGGADQRLDLFATALFYWNEQNSKWYLISKNLTA